MGDEPLPLDNMKKEGTNCIFQVDNVKLECSGVYTAVAKNLVGDCKTSAKVKVIKQPYFIKPLSDITVIEKQNLKLDADIGGFPDPDIEWMKDGKPINLKKSSGPEKPVLKKEGNNYSLSLTKVSVENEGIYSIIAKNQAGEVKCQASVVVQVLPTFSKPLKDVTLVNGKPLKLEVIVNGIPKPTVQWFKDEQLLVEPAYVQESKDKTHSVSIAETLEIHAGTYKAVAVNDAGKAETIANVDIQTKPTIIKPDDVKLISGQEFSLQVVIEGKPEPKIKWMKDKVELPASLGISVEKQEKGYLLYQKECNTNLNGTYSVTATNPAGSESGSFKVVVLAKPLIEKKLQDIELVVGKAAKFEATVSGLPVPDIIWKKDDQPIESDDRTTVETKGNSKFLHFKKTQAEDIGSYSIVATNEAGTDSSSAHLRVRVPPKVEMKEKTVDVLVKNSCELQAMYSGIPQPDILWFKDQKQIEENQNIKCETNDSLSKLTFLQIEPEHAGTYRCIAKNMAGEAEEKTTVNIFEPPTISKKLTDLTVIEGEKPHSKQK